MLFGFAGTARMVRRLKVGAVPSLNLGRKQQSANQESRRDMRMKARTTSMQIRPVSPASPTSNIRESDTHLSPADNGGEDDNDTAILSQMPQSEVILHADACMDTTTDPLPMFSTISLVHHVGVQTKNQEKKKGKEQSVALFDIDRMSDKQLHHHTGLETRRRFDCVLRSLGPGRHNLKYRDAKRTPRMSIPNQFLMTLTKLRLHAANVSLATWFNVTVKVVSNVFLTWINFMSDQWRSIDWWPSQDEVRLHIPADFRKHFPHTRVILDATEIPIDKPKNPAAQKDTWSNYKNKNTVKVVVGITPGGLVSFVSSAYGGSASDRQVVMQTNLPSICDPGDEIMVDKGFTVEDVFSPYGVLVNIPSFFRKGNRIKGTIIIQDRKRAAKRVHVERVIGLAKTYKIMRGPLTRMETSLADQITFVCFILCNFRPNIVPLTS